MNEQEMQRVLEILHPLDPETRDKVLKAVEESVDSERAAYKAAATDTCMEGVPFCPVSPQLRQRRLEMSERKICETCEKEMELMPSSPMYACAWCGRIESTSGIVHNPGKRK